VMSPRVRNRGAESALCRLAAIESRGIDGASAPRTPQCAGEPPCVARDESAKQKDDEPRGAKVSASTIRR
jgi:hypothetical protein